MSLFICPQEKCNRKYKTERTLLKHLSSQHQILKEHVDLSQIKKASTKKEKEKEIQQEAKLKMEAEERYKNEYFEEHARLRRQKEELELEKIRQQAEDDRKLRELKLKIEEERLKIIQNVKNNPDECAICFERPSGGAAVVPCGHAYFCLPCLMNIYENYKHRGCPYCRGNIDKIQSLVQ